MFLIWFNKPFLILYGTDYFYYIFIPHNIRGNNLVKILRRNHKKGVFKVLPESTDDLWHIYNIIAPKDEIHARTTREVNVEGNYSRPKAGRRISTFLGVKIEKVTWDKNLNRLRVHGIVCKAPEKISVKGSHHTINVTVGKPITIIKSLWLKHHTDRLSRASKAKPPIIIISIDNEEYCVALLRQYGIDIKVEGATRLPGKLEAEKRTKAVREFFKKASRALREVWMRTPYPIVVIGLGFIKNDFVKYLNKEASEVTKNIIDVKSVNSGGIAGIREALRSGILTSALKHVRIVEETKVMEEILTRLGKGKLDITYGFVDVLKASMFGAIEKLLLADIALREAFDERRLAFEKLMREVEIRGGDVMIISAEHEAGKKLLALGGIAALLRFPIG